MNSPPFVGGQTTSRFDFLVPENGAAALKGLSPPPIRPGTRVVSRAAIAVQLYRAAAQQLAFPQLDSWACAPLVPTDGIEIEEEGGFRWCCALATRGFTVRDQG